MNAWILVYAALSCNNLGLCTSMEVEVLAYYGHVENAEKNCKEAAFNLNVDFDLFDKGTSEQKYVCLPVGDPTQPGMKVY